MANKNGLETGYLFIITLPTETHRTIWSLLRLAVKINPTELIFGTMVPYLGTEIARMAAKGEGGNKLLTTDWDKYSKQLNRSKKINRMSHTMLEFYHVLGYVLYLLITSELLILFALCLATGLVPLICLK